MNGTRRPIQGDIPSGLDIRGELHGVPGGGGGDPRAAGALQTAPDHSLVATCPVSEKAPRFPSGGSPLSSLGFCFHLRVFIRCVVWKIICRLQNYLLP